VISIVTTAKMRAPDDGGSFELGYADVGVPAIAMKRE